MNVISQVTQLNTPTLLYCVLWTSDTTVIYKFWRCLDDSFAVAIESKYSVSYTFLGGTTKKYQTLAQEDLYPKSK